MHMHQKNSQKNKTIQSNKRVINILHGNGVDILIWHPFLYYHFINFCCNAASIRLSIPQICAISTKIVVWTCWPNIFLPGIISWNIPLRNKRTFFLRCVHQSPLVIIILTIKSSTRRWRPQGSTWNIGIRAIRPLGWHFFPETLLSSESWRICACSLLWSRLLRSGTNWLHYRWI